MVEKRVSILAILDDRLSKPLNVIRTRLAGVERGIRRTAAALAPLNSRLLALGTGLAGIQGGRQALDLARQQIQAEQVLLSALQGRTSELEKIKEVASEIQAITITGDEALLEQAAILVNMGVSAELIPKALRAAVETASALKLELSQVARGIALAATSGQLGILGSRLPFVKDLLDNGAEINEILDTMITRFEGAGAALAEGPFGEAEQLSNSIGDSMEEIGKVLQTFIVPVLRQVNQGLDKFVTFLGDARVESFLDILERITPLLVSAAAALAGFIGAATALTLLKPVFLTISGIFAGIFGIIAGIVSAIGIVPGIIALVLSRLVVMSGLWDKIKLSILSSTTGVRSFAGDIIDLFKAVVEGRADFESLFELIIVSLEIFALRFRRSVLIPIGAVFQAVRDLTIGTLDFVLGNVAAGVLVFADGFLELVQGIAQEVRDLFRVIGIEIGRIDVGDLLDAQLEAFAQRADAGATRAANAITNALEDAANKLSDTNDELLVQTTKAADIVANAEERAFENAKARVQKSGEEAILQILLLDEAITDSINKAGGIQFDSSQLFANLDLSTIKDALRGLDQESQAALTEIIQVEIERRRSAEELSAQETFRLRVGLLEQVSEREIQAIDDQIAETEELLATMADRQRVSDEYLDSELRTLEAMEREGVVVFLRRRQLEKIDLIQQGILESSRDQATEAQRLFDLETKRASLEIERARFEQSVRQQRQSLADEIVSEVEEARETLESKREEIANQILSGEILPAEGIRISAAALADFNSVADASQQELIDLTGTSAEAEAQAIAMGIAFGPVFAALVREGTEEAAAQLDDLIAKIKIIVKEANQSAPEGGFFAGLRTGISKTANVLGNFGIQAERIGARLIEDFGKGLVDVWSDNQKSFSDFSKSFLSGIAKMIAETILFNTISKAFGFFGFGTGGTADPPIAKEGGLFTGSRFVHSFGGGGSVPGPWTMRDSVNARLMPGEYVSDFDTVRHYGLEWFGAMKRRMIPRYLMGGSTEAPTPKRNYQDGGAVVPSQSSPQLARASVIADEQSFDRMLRGGIPSLLEVLGENGIRPA